MIQLKNEIVINESKEKVFAFLAEMENIPLWNYHVKQVKNITSNRAKKSKFLQIRKSDSQHFEIHKFLYPHLLVIRTVGNSKIKFKRSFYVKADHSGNCTLEDNFEIDLGYPQLIHKLFKSTMKKEVGINLGKLKELLEKGFTVLQNGRVSRLTS